MSNEYNLPENEEKLNEFLKSLAKKAKETGGAYLPDIKRQKQFYDAFTVLSHIIGENVVISYDIHKYPIKGSGAINIVGKEIKILDTRMFARVSRVASNMEVYPRTDGKVMMSFMFYGLYKRVDTVKLNDE